VFDLKVDGVSAVITDNGGRYIYKVVSEQVLPLDQVSEEIRNTLKSQRMKEMMETYANSYHTETNDAYFGPSAPSGPVGGRPPGQLPPHVPRPNVPPPPTQPQAGAPAANPTSQPPAQPAPPSKPN
jgi:hypothetical protein